MKKVILIIIVIGASWFFRYSLLSPFLKLSQEKILVNNFMESCANNVPNLQKIDLLATSNGGKPLPDDQLAKFKPTHEGSAKGWEMPYGAVLVISTDMISPQGKTAGCSISMLNLSSEFALALLSKKIHLGASFQNKEVSPGISARSWYTDNQGNEMVIGLIVVSSKSFSLNDYAVTLAAAKKIN